MTHKKRRYYLIACTSGLNQKIKSSQKHNRTFSPQAVNLSSGQMHKILPYQLSDHVIHLLLQQSEGMQRNETYGPGALAIHPVINGTMYIYRSMEKGIHRMLSGVVYHAKVKCHVFIIFSLRAQGQTLILFNYFKQVYVVLGSINRYIEACMPNSYQSERPGKKNIQVGLIIHK